MIYLLDTNVILEIVKKSPNKNVTDWLSSIDISKFSLSVLTFGEIRKGVEKLENQEKNRSLFSGWTLDFFGNSFWMMNF